MTYKAALFDLDDTLLASVEMKWLQHRTVAKRHYGIDVSEETMREVWGMPFTAMIEKTYQGVDSAEAIRALLLPCNDEFPKSVLEGAPEAIHQLLDADIHVGIITSAPTDAALYDLRRLGFDLDRFLCVHGDDAVAGHKPDPEVFDKALALLCDLGIGEDDVVYVGDLLIDLQAAAAAGLDFIAVTTGITQQHEFEAAGAETITAGIVTAVQRILEH